MLKNEVIHIANMLCTSCSYLVQAELRNLELKAEEITFCRYRIQFDSEQLSLQEIDQHLRKFGFYLAKSRNEILLGKIKKHAIDVIYHMSNQNSVVQKSDYLVEMMDMSYQSIARIFRKYEPITLEKYLILLKIERIKDLLNNDTYTLSEIAYMMDYSSVQYLSTQFKKYTGSTVSEYKEHPEGNRKPLDKLY